MDDQTLLGTLEHITFQNPESHFLVGRFLPESTRHPVTVKGALYNVHEGQPLKLWGRWEEHREYGLQFAVDAFMEVMPHSLEGIESYLASGVIPGIRAGLARRIVKAFGLETLEVLDTTPELLLQVPKFPRKLLPKVREAWQEHQAIREILVFLHAQGISQVYAERIFRTYGFACVETLKDNPYRLAMDVHGIGFRIADAIARRQGVPPDSPQRAEAGVLFAMEEITAQGHTGFPRGRLCAHAAKLLEIPPAGIAEAVQRLVGDGLLRAVEFPDAPPEEAVLFRPRLFRAEEAIAAHLRRIGDADAFARFEGIEARIVALERESGIYLAPEQREAALDALRHKVVVITGGPGTGKTTIVRFVLGLVRESLPTVALAAPTGKAAKRLSEATGRPASTIHRLLEAGAKGFERNADHPVEADMVIVDESSMIDTLLMQALLAAIPDHARLVLVGDVDQLPSVGPGTVLSDVIASGRFAVARLEKIFRQSESSRITSNAHRIRKGLRPDLSRPPGEELVDFYFMPEADPARIVEKIQAMLTERIPERFGLDPRADVQVLTPMHKGLTGAANLNRVLQEALNPQGEKVAFGGGVYRVGDKVMQTRNDYTREVFNGDMGEITALDAQERALLIAFDDREIEYEAKALENLTLGYAITVHKSQGSEYPAVILPLTTQHAIMLQRNLLYTAITRARQLIVLIGTEQAVSMAVRNAKPDARFTCLRQHLLGPVGVPAAAAAP